MDTIRRACELPHGARPGIAFGVIRAVETFGQVHIIPTSLSLGSGPFSLDLGVNAWGRAVCTAGFVMGAVLAPRTGLSIAGLPQK